MKISKIILFIMVTIFLFSTVGFCDAVSSMDDEGQHCIDCCNAGCCYSMVLSSGQITAAPLLSAFLIQHDAVLRQELFLSGIEYPPKNLI